MAQVCARAAHAAAGRISVQFHVRTGFAAAPESWRERCLQAGRKLRRVSNHKSNADLVGIGGLHWFGDLSADEILLLIEAYARFQAPRPVRESMRWNAKRGAFPSTPGPAFTDWCGHFCPLLAAQRCVGFGAEPDDSSGTTEATHQYDLYPIPRPAACRAPVSSSTSAARTTTTSSTIPMAPISCATATTAPAWAGFCRATPAASPPASICRPMLVTARLTLLFVCSDLSVESSR
jgi:hypothetical protein